MSAPASQQTSPDSPPLRETLRHTPFAVTYAGQGTPWLGQLAAALDDPQLTESLTALVTAAEDKLRPIAAELYAGRPVDFDPITWAKNHATNTAPAGEEETTADSAPVPTERVLSGASQSMPGIVLAQIALTRQLAAEGLDFDVERPIAALGHSQGVLTAHMVTAGIVNDDDRLAELLAIAQLIGVGSVISARKTGLIRRGAQNPMVSVTSAHLDQVAKIVAGVAATLDDTAPVLGLINDRTRAVIVGRPADIALIETQATRFARRSAKALENKQTGGAPFDPVFGPLDIEVGFHHPAHQPIVDTIADWAQRAGLDAELARTLAQAVLVEPVDFAADVTAATAAGARWILDMGPNGGVAPLVASTIAGSGVGLLSVADAAGRAALFDAGAAPAAPLDYSAFAPRLITLPNGRTVVETSFTKVTGRSPILLAGMTPTTVDPAIVAAAANAGHWAELAGGGQVTEQILTTHLERLTELLEPGRAAQFNSMFLDPYLWGMHIGGKKGVQRARAAGTPLDGVVITAGIPPLEEATALVAELTAAGLTHVAFKPGTVKQIDQCIAIADAVDVPVIFHIEGGHAGGHHSWEDLDDLLIATYAKLRRRDNIVICVGGGIGTPQRSADYLTGTWAHRHNLPAMPVDGILVGTAAMATLEATTSDSVKQLLVDTPGTPNWVGAGRAEGQVASGRSQLGADIHEIDNAAARCGRLLDEVAGDAEAVAARRDEIITALDTTAKPYFGDVATMTYAELLRRYAELSGPRATDTGWLDISWRARFEEFLQRAEARLNPADSGDITTTFTSTTAAGQALLDDPASALAALIEAYPAAETTTLHPADRAHFFTTLRTPGKPVNFVPVIDADVRRWWRSDSLWQAHDDRYDADQVCVIPGPVAVAGITRKDEPVGELLDRFEAEAVSRIGGTATARIARRGTATESLVALALAAPNALWAGRLVINPLHRVAAPELWELTDNGTAVDPISGAELRPAGDSAVELVVDLGSAPMVVTLTLGDALRDGGVPVISDEAAAAAMRQMLAVAAGGTLPTVVDGTATITTTIGGDQALDHTGVTGELLPGELTTTAAVPDSLVGRAWPAIFATLGEATAADGTAAIEGLLSLVHLDHIITLDKPLPTTATEVEIQAAVIDVDDTEIGRLITVSARIGDIAELTERFCIRNRNGRAPFTVLSPLDEVTPVTRRKRVEATVIAPNRMNAFAQISGDHNPIHVNDTAAALAGLDSGVIVHGMWVSAMAQHVLAAANTERGFVSIRLFHTQMQAPVLPGDEITFRADRIGLINGGEVLELTGTVGDTVVLAATALLDAPKTFYALPGQGIQSAGMGMAGRTRSKAARAVWDRADAHTRTKLGFSILAVVRDNPTAITVAGERYHHPKGVLFLTQFTQVAMATLGCAQVAEMRESGVFNPDSCFAGHSVGEYNSLAAIGEVLSLESVVEIVFRRGLTMHRLVERDADGNSNYGLGALRPNKCGVDADQVEAYVTAIAEQSGEFLQIVNYNLRGAQYAVAGTNAGLAALAADAEQRAAALGNARALILIPGIDVPFHSMVLRDGVDDFRAHLESLLPADIDLDALVGRYIPNLVARPFEITESFVRETAELTPTGPLPELAANFADAIADRQALGRTLLIELLAWQFASPVRWIETQDLAFSAAEKGGLGIERFVEIGVATAPTVANLAAQTLRRPEHLGRAIEVYNLERDAAALFGTDADPVDDAVETTADTQASAQAPAASTESASTMETRPAPTPAAAGRPDDLPYTTADATRLLIGVWTKVKPTEIAPTDTIESLVDGVSSRRNQLLMDLGVEFNLGAIDGAADAPIDQLAQTVTKMARGYVPFGPVLSDALADGLRRATGPAGKRPAYVGDYVRESWQLESGWVQHVTAAVALDAREGVVPTTAKDLDALIDAHIGALGASRGVAVAKPVAGGGGGAMVDAAALGEFTEHVTGKAGVLAKTARLILEELGHEDIPVAAVADAAAADEATLALVERELGSDWLKAVAPSFDATKALQLDDRWASAREDVLRIAAGDADALGLPTDTFRGTGQAVAEQATYAAEQVSDAAVRAKLQDIAAAATDTETGIYAEDIAVVTGASKGSIAAAVVSQLLAGGATVIATTSRLGHDRSEFYKELYRTHARGGAALWVVPANLASFSDVDALIEWIGSEQSQTVGSSAKLIKPALNPSLLFPFAAPPVMGTAADAGPRAETEMRLLLWSVEKLVTGLSALAQDTDVHHRMHAVLPGSPNRGRFGGDGAYGESKAALDALVQRWHAETAWAPRVSLVHALIGWVRGTGLMGHNDPLVEAVEAAGVRTWATEEMAAELLSQCTPQVRSAAATTPVTVDFTGGLGEVDLDLAALAADRPQATAADTAATAPAVIAALPNHTGVEQRPEVAWNAEVTRDLEDMVVIVGYGEVGPLGSSRTRFDAELNTEISAAGIVELAWSMGLITWETDPQPGWVVAESGEPIAEAAIADTFREQVTASVGVRRYADDGVLVDNTQPELTEIFLEKDMSFPVSDKAAADSFVASDPENTYARFDAELEEWVVVRKAGTAIYVPRRMAMSRFVGGQIPTGFNPAVYGLPQDIIDNIDRVSQWNIVSAVDAFISAGFTPSELLAHVHAGLVSNTQGTGIGAMESLRGLYIDGLLGAPRANDILQEALPNVIAAHVMQSYVGGYGQMIHPVAACATAAVSVEEGFDKIALGKADFVVAGGFDDLSTEGITGFGDMAATADSQSMRDKGIEDKYFSRANDRRRGGFVESQGGGTVLLARASLAAEMGLPVYGVVGYAASFADGAHTSIPAPGMGALGAGRGGQRSALYRQLAALGVGADEIAVISKHDTSTNANDPNESELHERLAAALGRSTGNPLMVISQKTLTGHAKGGAAAFQMIGLCQVLRSGSVPANRSLDCVDPVLAGNSHLVWLRQPLQATAPLKAGFVTSLGFGHVSALVAIVHPQAFLEALRQAKGDAAVSEYREAAAAREAAGRLRLVDAMCGGQALFERPAGRRLGDPNSDAGHELEAEMLLDENARLGDDGVYKLNACR